MSFVLIRCNLISLINLLLYFDLTLNTACFMMLDVYVLTKS